ncbi:MAG: 50S ribosomal protein L21 [Brevinemataceae bacterium]
MYAIVEIGGQSHKAEKGAEFLVNLISQEKDSTIEFDKVTMITDNGNTEIGTPYLSAKITAQIVEPEVKGKKLTVFKYKNKTNYHVKTGHRQKFTLIKIIDIKK